MWLYQLLTAGCPTCLLSVYLPTRSRATDEFKEALDFLDATLGLYGLDDVYILGDLNADLGTEGAPKHVHLPMSTAVSYSDIYADGSTYHLHLSPSQSTYT